MGQNKEQGQKSQYCSFSWVFMCVCEREKVHLLRICLPCTCLAAHRGNVALQVRLEETRHSKALAKPSHLERDVSHRFGQVIGLQAVPVVQMLSQEHGHFQRDCKEKEVSWVCGWGCPGWGLVSYGGKKDPEGRVPLSTADLLEPAFASFSCSREAGQGGTS